MQNKHDLFLKLKPPCVALNQAISALGKTKNAVEEVTTQLGQIGCILRRATCKPHAIDAKLAEYVFFPISNVLRASQRVSLQCLELSLECIAILVEQGWKGELPPQLAAQIVILCSLLAEKRPRGLSFTESTTELQVNSFACLKHVFHFARHGSTIQQALISDAHVPQLGQAISVILEGIYDGVGPEAQIAATNALQAMVVQTMDKDMQARFLPGIVSKITKVLSPRTKGRRNHQVLTGCLDILDVLLSNTMSDEALSVTATKEQSPVNGSDPPGDLVDEKWQEMAAAQLKPALGGVMRLSMHARDDVRQGLGTLCMTLLRKCRPSLSNCSTMALETMIDLSVTQNSEASLVELELLLHVESSVATLLQEVLWDWLQSLATIMQGADEQAKISKIQQIRAAYELLLRCEAISPTLERKLASALSEGVVSTIALPGSNHGHQAIDTIQSLDLKSLDDQIASTEFPPALVKNRGQAEVLQSIEGLTTSIGVSKPTVFAEELLRAVQRSEGEMQIANFWLLLTACLSALQRQDSVDDLLNLDLRDHGPYEGCLEELHNISTTILTQSSEESQDQRLQALALRSLALRARFIGRDFRYELVDALYPVLHTLATPDEELQQDSITTLNVFTSACEYNSVKDLIVENVDYLTNAVALKLNAFDISPQAPQILLMMVRLAGPSLLPYLDDTVDSIFAALEDYHGYPLLVELLFRVLSVMAQEGAKAPQLALTGPVDHERLSSVLDDSWSPIAIGELPSLLRQRREDDELLYGPRDEELKPHPQKPWGSAETADANAEEDEDGGVGSDQPVEETEPPPPAPKVYHLLLRITELTQHFLPSASPSLRTSLLSLIRTTIPVIAKHENTFLPLINTLWPEIVSRLDDPEQQVVASALDIIGVLCEHAQQFMRSRILQLWPRFVELYRTCSRQIVHSQKAASTKASRHAEETLVPSPAQLRKSLTVRNADSLFYNDTSTRALWTSLSHALASVVAHVSLPPERFDLALEMLEPIAASQGNLLQSLERANPDAVWLAGVKSGRLQTPAMPRALRDAAWRFAECAV